MTSNIILFLSLIISINVNSLAGIKAPFQSTEKIILNKKSINLAYKLDRLYHEVRKSKLSPKLAKSTLKQVKKDPLFENIQSWVKDVKDINIFKTPYSHMKKCKKVSSKLKRFCINTFLIKFQKRNVYYYLKKYKKIIKRYGKRSLIKKNLKVYSSNKRKILSRKFFHKRNKKFSSSNGFRKRRDKILKDAKLNKVVYTDVVKLIKDFDLMKFESSLVKLSKELTQVKLYKSSRYILKKLLNLKDSNREKIIFNYLWSYIESHNYQKGLDFVMGNKKLRQEVLNLESERINFWIAFLYEKNDNKAQAKAFYSNIIKDTPLSYYAVMSSKELSRLTNKNFQHIYDSLFKKSHTNSKKQLNYHPEELIHLKRVKVWSTVPNIYFQSISTNAYLAYGYRDRYLKLAKVHQSTKNFLESFKSTYKGLELNEIELSDTSFKILYPMKYFKPLKKYSDRVNPYVALSLIRQESAFNKKAISHVGARGLMQIMPRTGKSLYKRLRKSQLYNPYLNIKLGTRYLQKLLKKYDNNLVHALSAYNAGDTRVRRWKKNYFDDSSIYHNIERIPFNETRKYVKLIFRNIFFYKFLDASNKRKNTKHELASYNPNYLYDIYLGY